MRENINLYIYIKIIMSSPLNPANLPNPSEILCKIVDIKKELQIKTVDEVSEKFSDFKDKYPHIFKKIITTDDNSELFNMLKLISQVKNGDVSLDFATTKVGHKMANKYIPEEILKDEKPK